MAISLVHADAATLFETSATTINVTIDADVATGDLILIAYMIRSNLTLPSGWTKHAEIEIGIAGSRSGFMVKTSDGTEGGTTVAVTQATANRMEAAHIILRGSVDDLSVSQTSSVDADAATSAFIPDITEVTAFAAVSAAHNAFSAASVQNLSIGAGSDAEFLPWANDISTNANSNRLRGAYGLYTGADTATLEWDCTYTSLDWGASMLTVIEGAAAITVNVGAATETDTANTIASGQITVIVGTATESDAGNVVTPPVIKGASVTLYSGATLQASITGITAMWWDSSPPAGNPVFTTASASTDASGVLTVNLDSTTALPIGDPGHLSAYKLDGVDEKDSLAWQGQLLVEDIS